MYYIELLDDYSALDGNDSGRKHHKLKGVVVREDDVNFYGARGAITEAVTKAFG